MEWSFFLLIFFLFSMYRFSSSSLSLSLPLATNTIHQFCDGKKAPKLLHHIRYKCFNFLYSFFSLHFTIHRHNKQHTEIEKNTQLKPIFMRRSCFCITCARTSLFVYAIHSKSTKELRLGSPIVVIFYTIATQKKTGEWKAEKKRKMQEINIISPDLLITLLIFFLSSLEHYLIWSG